MKDLLMVIFLLSGNFINIQAQTMIGNLDLEDWKIEVVNDTQSYEEPGGVWATGNKTVRLGFPQTTFRTTDAYSGTYAAKIYTDESDFTNPPLITSGTLATGIFEPDYKNPLNSLKLGTPFTGRPEVFSGYFKYNSVNNDSFDIYAIVSKWDNVKKKRITIGAAMFQDSVSYPKYTKFSIPFEYKSGTNPDTITVVFASSAAGDYFIGNVGSALFIDEISLTYSNGIEVLLMPELDVDIYPVPAKNSITFEIHKPLVNGRLLIYSSDGKEVLSYDNIFTSNNIDISGLSTGTYYYKITDSNSLINTGSFFIRN